MKKSVIQMKALGKKRSGTSVKHLISRKKWNWKENTLRTSGTRITRQTFVILLNP